MQLLRNNAVPRTRVDSANDSWRKECQALNSDVVQQKDEGCGQYDGVEDASDCLLFVKLVQDLILTDALRLDASDGQILFLLAEPSSSLWSVCEGDEGDEREEAGDDSLDGEDHAPLFQRAK